MAHTAVTLIVDISTRAHIINRLACINIHAKTNHTNFFLIKSDHQSFDIIDLIIM